MQKLFGTLKEAHLSPQKDSWWEFHGVERRMWEKTNPMKYVCHFPKTNRIVKAIHQRCLVEDNHRLLGHMLIFAVVSMHGKTIRPLCNSNMHNSDTEYNWEWRKYIFPQITRYLSWLTFFCEKGVAFQRRRITLKMQSLNLCGG